MDMKPFMSGIIAVAAAAVTASAVLYGQVITQKHENIRHLRALAYQSAMEEWRVKVETIREAKCYEQLPHFSDILLEHIVYTHIVQKYGSDDKFTGTLLERMINSNLERHIKKLSREPKPDVATDSPEKQP